MMDDAGERPEHGPHGTKPPGLMERHQICSDLYVHSRSRVRKFCLESHTINAKEKGSDLNADVE